MDTKYCQCCGMPMGEGTELYGTNSDGSVNEDALRKANLLSTGQWRK